MFHPLARLNARDLPNYKSTILKLNFEGIDRVIPQGRGILSHRSNFFYGNDSSKWCTNVPNFQEIIYEDLYENIDLRYYTNSNGLKYDFIVHPGGDPNNIILGYEGFREMHIDSSGNIKIITSIGNFFDSGLFIYQQTRSEENIINGKFKIIDLISYTFEIVGNYDKTMDLIIDPLIFSTFAGGNDYDWGGGIRTDFNGNAVVVGSTKSSNFPNTTGSYDIISNGGFDVFVLKLNSMGSTLIYSTFIGGSDWDHGLDIDIDSNYNIYVIGRTRSPDFPNTTLAYDPIFNGIEDIFVLKLNSTGSSLIFSTFIGGRDLDWGEDIAIDSTGNSYITGRTFSLDFPNTTGAYDNSFNGVFDLYVLKLNSTGSSLVYSTFIGGNSWDYGLGIVIDSNFNAIITGQTNSTNFPNTTNVYDSTYNGDFDVFVVKLNHNGSKLIYSTFIGNSKGEGGYCISIDSSDNVYVSGWTQSSNFPTTKNVFDNTYNQNYDIFVFKLNSIGSSLIFSTFIGGSNSETSFGIKINSNDNIYITGATHSADFPNTTGAFDNSFNGKIDVFILSLNPLGSSLLYSTFIGGNSYDEGTDIVIEPNDYIYITGDTYSDDFPNTTGAFDNSFNGGVNDAFVLKLNISINDSYPFASDFDIAKPSIFRTDSVNLYSNASDIEDPEQNLKPHFEYRDTNNQVWNNTFFSKPQYNNSRWETAFTPPKTAELGLFDFRIRFNDTYGLCSRWLYLNESLNVLNNIPKVDNLSLSDQSTLVNNNISIWINSSDIEEPEENLSIELEYRNPDGLSWDTTYLTLPKYINNRWESNFTIPCNASFGYYDFRTRFNDTDGTYSQWLYANDSLLIYNDYPKVIDIELFNNSVYRANSVFIFINGTDHETSESGLTFYGQYRPNGTIEWIALTGEYSNTNARWESKFVTNKESILGTYDLRVRYEDNESASTGWVYINDSLEVLNNPPIISDDLDDILVGLSTVLINLSQYGSDIEDSTDELTWVVNETIKYRYLESLRIINKGILELKPQINVRGSVEIELTLNDKDGGIAIKSDITVDVDSLITDFIPQVTLLSPINGTEVNILTPTLKWELNYSGDKLITYIIYLDKATVPKGIIKSNTSMTSFTLENELENKNTYYWSVIPRLNEINGTCLSGFWSFKVDIPLPIVILKTPENNSEINSTLPTLVWSVEYEGSESIFYDVYFGTNKDPPLEYEKSTTTHFAIDTTLQDNTTYYWKIVPWIGKYEGFSSEIWSFTVDLKNDKIPEFGIELVLDPNPLEITPGEVKFVSAFVTNLGEQRDNFTVTIGDINNLKITAENYRKDTLEIAPGENKEFLIMVSIKDGTGPGFENITISAKSNLAEKYNLDMQDSDVLTIKVLEKDDHNGKERGQPISIFYFSILLLIIILIIISIIILIIVRKKSSKKDTKIEETQDIIPETAPKSITPPEPKSKIVHVTVPVQQLDETLEE